MTPIIYLHGFASSPNSKKAMVFAGRFQAAGIQFQAPDLNAGDFFNLTLTSQLRIVEEAAAGQPVSVIGSSMGGYIAALYAARHPEVERVVLLAPAFGFARLWAESLGSEQVAAWERTGVLEVVDYAAGRPAGVSWGLMEDSRRYEDEPVVLQPTLIYHGVHDTVVPVQVSRNFARTRTSAELREVDSDHELLNVVDEVWEGTYNFLFGAGGDKKTGKGGIL
ncbi:MAG: alpha/beta fold hydrolase [Acidobacteria bacterium]|nr:alpha/beta fold hydrolase [Acidobacteriota bacterium]